MRHTFGCALKHWLGLHHRQCRCVCHNSDNLLRAAEAVVNFCYSAHGTWVGTETLRESSKFIALIYQLSQKVRERKHNAV